MLIQMWAYLSTTEVLNRLGFTAVEDHPSAGERDAVPINLSPIGKWLFNFYKPRHDVYIEAYTAWSNTAKRSAEHNLTLKNTEKDVKEAVRQLYIYIKANPITTDEDKLEMGFPVHEDTVHTPSAVPDSWPVAEVLNPSVGVLHFQFTDSKSHKRGKPKGVHGALIRWLVSETMPAHWEELINKTFATSQPITLVFDVSMQGKTIYYSTCWENNAGKQGLFSPIAKAIIA
jgi:hypothetical protein